MNWFTSYREDVNELRANQVRVMKDTLDVLVNEDVPIEERKETAEAAKGLLDSYASWEEETCKLEYTSGKCAGLTVGLPTLVGVTVVMKVILFIITLFV